jgi:starch synthase
MPQPLKVCYASSEVAPFAKTGGLADVSAALPRQLHRMGHDVRVFLPFYSDIDRTPHDYTAVDFIQDI